MTSSDDLVVIGRIGRPHGIGGEMRATPTGATLATLKSGERVVLAGASAGPGREYEITSFRPVDRGVLIRLGGIVIREDAAALTGATIAVPDSRLQGISEPDEFYVRDLIGCVVNAGEALLGQVVEVYPGAANDALVVRSDEGKDILVPFTKDAVTELDLLGRRVGVRPDLFGAPE